MKTNAIIFLIVLILEILLPPYGVAHGLTAKQQVEGIRCMRSELYRNKRLTLRQVIHICAAKTPKKIKKG